MTKLSNLIVDAIDMIAAWKPHKTLQQTCDETGAIPLEDFGKEFMRRIDWHYNDKQISSGLMEFDKAIDGYKPGKLIVIGVPPADGKTEFIISLMAGLAVENSVPVGVFSLEFPNVIVIKKILMNTFNFTWENLTEVADSFSTEMLKKIDDAPIY
ncbi:MAG: hypothetical protein K2N91_08400, partial [Muribaculaceae bacterium]|nr:hypothetical protein [Muribaculaceae bacterium]